MTGASAQQSMDRVKPGLTRSVPAIRVDRRRTDRTVFERLWAGGPGSGRGGCRLIIARDGADDDALARRRAARPAHLEERGAAPGQGHLLVGGALTDEAGSMVGSAAVAQFADPRRARSLARNRPYVTQGVWRDIEVIPYRVAPHHDFPPCPQATDPGPQS